MKIKIDYYNIYRFINVITMFIELKNEINLITNRTIPFTSFLTNFVVISNFIFIFIEYLTVNDTNKKFLYLIGISYSFWISLLPYLEVDTSDSLFLLNIIFTIASNYNDYLTTIVELIIVGIFVNYYTKYIGEEHRNNFNLLFCLLNLQQTMAFYAMIPIMIFILQIIRGIITSVNKLFVLTILIIIIKSTSNQYLNINTITTGLYLMIFNTMEPYHNYDSDILLFIFSSIMLL
jgi:hypothetical protein